MTRQMATHNGSNQCYHLCVIIPSFFPCNCFIQAIEGFGTLRLGKWQQMMVPIKEMTDVMRVVKEVVSVKPKQWVRLKRGIYKDDLAQVHNKIIIAALADCYLNVKCGAYI